ncbi:trypsin-like peptidase domain-containing protein [Ammoniphilus sp. YIM 78166]|uniref:trypsin-like peptidase domain-containing protein n=1 Tax=Ammoniphilus sp. YIM 78166 TaxID=1644106 RepID=UPI0010703BC7|nr:trypsin-like peptidase domain-containing protein [Ammoniphilus sp. YIM 78166]
MKSWLPLVLALFIFFPSFPSSSHATTLATGFKDVPPAHWAENAILWGKNTGMVKGYPDGTFRPAKQVSEAEFMVMLFEAYQPAGLHSFKATRHWSDPYYLFAQSRNYPAQGYQKVEIRNLALNRERVAELIAGVDGVHFTGPQAIQYVLSKGYAKGKVPGVMSIEAFKGKDALTRAEAVQFVKNLTESGMQELKPRPVQATPQSQLPSLPSSEQPVEGKPLSFRDIADLGEKSVVMIVNYDQNGEEFSLGSGISIGNGLVLTNAHVVEGAGSIGIVTQDETEIEALGLVRYDADLDLAILKVSQELKLQAAPLGSYRMVQKGDPIVTIGSPEGLINTLSNGLVSGIRKIPFTPEGATLDMIQITAPITSGSSGGALFAMNGLVVGMTSFGNEQGNLNFAIAIDHAKPWIDELTKMPLASIPTIPYPEIASQPVHESPVPPAAEQPVELTPPDSKLAMTVNGYVKDALLHPVDPILYVINKEEKGIYRINYETKQSSFLRLPLMPEKLFYANNELYVALATRSHSSYWWDNEQTGAIAIINPLAWEIMDQFELDIDPFDLVVADGVLYVSSGSGQWTRIKSYSRDKKLEIASHLIRQGSYLQLHPEGDRIISIDTDSSPRDMQSFQISKGQFIDVKDSPYHGDYAMSPLMRLSPDGRYIFNGAGTIFTSSMHYVTNLQRSFSDVAFHLTGDRFYLASKNRIIEYQYSDWEPVKVHKLTGESDFLFYHQNQLISVSKINLRGAIYGIETLDLK